MEIEIVQQALKMNPVGFIKELVTEKHTFILKHPWLFPALDKEYYMLLRHVVYRWIAHECGKCYEDDNCTVERSDWVLNKVSELTGLLATLRTKLSSN
jgi:hypothetical protein